MSETKFDQEYFLHNPPGVVMPEVDPSTAPWKQGEFELCMSSWWGFWNIQLKEEKEEYFNNLNAPENWRNYLNEMDTFAELDN